ncbi:E3 SUMO-protein ligase ZBED1-like [Maniola jurtina]|uniref:E3 SUMO-protein ligase ZBED1-like n=1 Tax=Maniola jurtina TaxID=191418 RepID=UPI001E68C7B8|nr:E3 SUMO-protein ligase ZBED1-like [Maniola jurtina]
MNNKRSKLWGFFTQTKDDKAKCDLCNSLYSVKGGSTTNLKKHLIKKHRSTYETIIPCSVSDAAVLEAPIPSTSSNTESIQPVNKTNESNPQQTKLSAFIKRPVGVVREKKINDLIFKMIVLDLQPFSVVEDAGFKNLINYLEPGYKMPSRYILSNTLLDAQYAEVQKKLKEELESAKYISITTDGWTSRATTSYQAVTAHYLLNWQLKSALLGCFECHERHTAEYIKNELYSLLSHWSIQNKIFVCVTDNAANMKAAIRLTNYEHLPCVAHTLNLVVRAGLQDCGLGELIKKIKVIVEHFHKSSIATKKLISMQEQLMPNQKALKLKMDVITRWNSTLDMIERISSLQEPLEACLGILHNPVENLSEGEWQSLPEIIKILKPFKQLTEEMSSEKKVTVSMVLASTESMMTIFHNLDTNIITDTGKKLTNKILTEFKSRFKNCYRHPVLSKAALLDPRFKKLAFRFDTSSYESAKDALKTELQNEFNFHKQPIERNENESTLAIYTGDTDADNDSLWKDFDALATSASASNSMVSSSIITMRQYLEERIIPRNECPLKWWQARAILYPELSNLAEKYLSVMASSVPSERTFSKSGQILSERRSSIQPKRMEKILFLNMNQRFLP